MSVCEHHGVGQGGAGVEGVGGYSRENQEQQRKVSVVVGGKTEPCSDWLSVLRPLRRYNLKLSERSHK